MSDTSELSEFQEGFGYGDPPSVTQQAAAKVREAEQRELLVQRLVAGFDVLSEAESDCECNSLKQCDNWRGECLVVRGG